MREMLSQINYSISQNLTATEAIIFVVLGMVAWFNRKDKNWLLVAYNIFIILYITLLRRASGYNENIRLHLKLWSNVGVGTGNLLNLFLYMPLGMISWQWKQNCKRIVAYSFILSVFCEVIQYITHRGMADVNDVLFNTLGTAVGAWISKNVQKSNTES